MCKAAQIPPGGTRGRRLSAFSGGIRFGFPRRFVEFTLHAGLPDSSRELVVPTASHRSSSRTQPHLVAHISVSRGLQSAWGAQVSMTMHSPCFRTTTTFSQLASSCLGKSTL